MATRIIFNGSEYESHEAMPEDVLRAYRQALADTDADGASAGRRRVLAGLDQAQAVLAGIMRVLLGGAAVAVFVGAILIMVGMDASSRSQGGRVYVAVAAVVALGAVDSRFDWLARRRWLLAENGDAEYRRYRVRSLLVLVLAAAVLLGLAVFLP